MRLEILVTTMHQQDAGKYQSMNLQTDAVIANQADRNETLEEWIDGKHVKLVTTNTRGTSKNRNIALEHAEADLLMFSDDDLTFYDGYEQIVLSEFEKHPEADAIRFNVRQIAGRETTIRPITEFHAATRRNVTQYGMMGIAIKKDMFEKHGLRFDENFGPGTENSCGEDTIFLQEMLKKKVKLYLSPETIADIDQTESTWFEGYENEKYFITSGKVIARAYPILSYGLVIRSAVKCVKNKKSKLPFMTILKAYYKGVIRQTFHK